MRSMRCISKHNMFLHVPTFAHQAALHMDRLRRLRSQRDSLDTCVTLSTSSCWKPDVLLLQDIVDSIGQRGWCVVPKLLPVQVLHSIRGAALESWHAGCFKPAQVGRGSTQTKSKVRSDHILWLPDESEVTEYEAQLVHLRDYHIFLAQLRQLLNRAMFLSMRRFEGHLAVYPPGAFYGRHLDQHQASRHRIMSAMLYLNKVDWHPEDGGQLRMYLPFGEDVATHALPGGMLDAPQITTGITPEGEQFIDVLPTGGTFVLFRSDLVSHEVLPSQHDRLSFTGWMRDDDALMLGQNLLPL